MASSAGGGAGVAAPPGARRIGREGGAEWA